VKQYKYVDEHSPKEAQYGEELFKVGEALFRPELLGLTREVRSVPSLVKQSILMCDSRHHEVLWSSILPDNLFANLIVVPP
jgi:hypothetical protein